ncbi:hypothetical protein [Cohnella soli]|uniref:Uncharacterized protein n=1 Tax=Cohnella soli TaxID=425005 RepID=A0ABW0I1H9_9BACL
MREFIDLVQEIFPSIDPDTASNAYRALEKELKSRNRPHLDIFRTSLLGLPSQGDIFTNLVLPYVNDEGELASFDDSIGMLLTCGCDFDRDQHVKFAVAHPLDVLVEAGLNPTDIRNQVITGFMYLPLFEHKGREYVVDFSVISSFNTTLLRKLIEAGQIERIRSLNDFGYYLLLAKLSIHFLRPEDNDSSAERAS